MIFALSAIFSLSPIPVTFAESNQKEFYAKVTDDDIYLYSSASASLTSQLFEIPKSYFVLLLAEKGDFFYARYNDVYGYVRKSQVSAMDGAPEMPFFTSSMRVITPGGLPLYSKPSSQDGEVVESIPFLNQDITYYGKCSGEKFIPDKGSTWIFCKYTTGESSFQGYLYSLYCDSYPEEIPLNTETFPLITAPLFPEVKPDQLAGLSNTAKILIIVGVSVPCAVILYLLIRPTLSHGNLQKNKRTPFKRKRKTDYFEFDESDLG